MATFAVTFVYQFNAAKILNDHIYRVLAGRQILVAGEVPHRDFFDPGYLLTLYSSALAQALLGHGLLGERLLSVAAQSVGFCLVFVMASRLAGSRWLGGVAVLGAVLAEPRLYDYDKVVFLALGAFACWRYADRPSLQRGLVLGVVAALALLFRYDSALYLGSAALATIVVVHARDLRAALRAAASALAGGAALVAPVALTLAGVGALGPYVRQITEYAALESRRTGLRIGGLATLPAPNTGSAAMDAAVVLLYYGLVALPWVGLALALWRRRVGNPPGNELARVAALAGVAIGANYFLLRDPLEARIGGVAGPGMVLAAWIAAVVLGGRPARGDAEPTTHWRAAQRAVALAAAATVVVLGLRVEHLGRRFDDSGLVRGPVGLVRRSLEVAGRGWTQPPALELLPDAGYAPVVRYLRQCTDPGDRVLVGWFGPEVAYFSGRLFAGGIGIFFGGHWAGDADSARIVERLRVQPVPIAILRTPDTDLAPRFGAVDAYLRANYRPLGAINSATPGFEIWAHVDRSPTGRFDELDLPCFARP